MSKPSPEMTPDRWAEVERRFAEALDLPPGERTEFVAAIAEATVRAEVAALLEAHDADPEFLEARPPWLPTVEGASAGEAPESVPEEIGGYRIERPLGRGGMGQVYLAVREAAGFRQTVALKVMRRGLDTDDLIRRFRAERQILAGLDHPNISRLLDVGAMEDGRPYFVMEYVEGRTLTDHARDNDLSIPERLRLFRTICGAVHHAHQALVVHRDLKPGNILVSADGVPKLLDFGIAKILDPDRAGIAATTLHGARLLTPEYSAPEQIRGEVITTATDVYALGVLLYELLADRHPLIDGGGEPTSRETIIRSVLHDVPAPPSARVGAARRGRLAGDLDTIVAKAMRKEPEERYASALSLAEDLDRHLEGLPVRARPATVGYRARRFVRRNRAAVAAGAVVFVLLAGFGAIMAYQAARIQEEAALAAAERDQAIEVRAFLLETFGTTGADQTEGDSMTVRAMLDGRAATLEESYPDPVLRAEMTGVLAEAYEKVGLFREAEPLARTALEAKEALHGPEHPNVAVARNVLGWILRQRGDLEAARAQLEESVRVGRAAFPGGDARLARALNDLGVVLEATGDYSGAADLYRESLAMRRDVLGSGHVGVAVTTSNLAVVLYRQGAVDSAAAMAAEAVARFREALGPDHQRTLIALGNLAAIRGVQGDHEGAAGTYGDILARHRRVLGDAHPQVAYALTMRANQLVALDRHREAEPLVRDALSIQRAAFGDDDERVARTLRVLADVLHARGQPAEAVERFETAARITADRYGPQHHEVAVLRLRMARARDDLGQDTAAEADYAAAAGIFDAALGVDHYLTAEAFLSMAEFLVRRGRLAEARSFADRAAPTIAGLGANFEQLRERLAGVTAALEGTDR